MARGSHGDAPLTLQLTDPGQARAALRRNGFVLVREVMHQTFMSHLARLAMDAIDDCGVHITRQSGDETLDYQVVTGDRIRMAAAPLSELYGSPALLAWIRCVTEVDDLPLSSHVRSSININYLHRTGQRYPWHTDAVPFTAVLFLATLPESAGGELLVRTLGGEVIEIRPTSGDLVLMDGNRCPHAVAPLREDVNRLTVPMVYPAQQLERPAGLDDYLYEPTVNVRMTT